MGNRSYLYITTTDGNHEIAEANNNIPCLWQLMLADAAVGEPIRDQRVFGDLDTDNLVVPLSVAVERARQVLEFVSKHPSGARLPALARRARAIRDYLQQLLSEHGKDAELSASFDELAWLEDDGEDEDFADQFATRLREQFTAVWGEVHDSLSRHDHGGFDAALADSAPLHWSRDWDYWQWHFGLASFGNLAADDGEADAVESGDAPPDGQHPEAAIAEGPVPARSPTRIVAKLIATALFALVFGGLYALLRDSGGWQYLPAALGSWLIVKAWRV